jgi:hypothetical protein
MKEEGEEHKLIWQVPTTFSKMYSFHQNVCTNIKFCVRMQS